MADAIAARMPRPAAPPSSTEPRYLTRREATRDYRVEVKALLVAERAGQLPAFGPGTAVVYRRIDLEAWIASTRVEPHASPPAPANDAEAEDPFERAVTRAKRRSGT